MGVIINVKKWRKDGVYCSNILMIAFHVLVYPMMMVTKERDDQGDSRAIQSYKELCEITSLLEL
jgi:hypothetical protein